MSVIGKRAAQALLLVAGSAVLGSCVDEDVVFDQRPVYQQVAAEAGGFVGYADPSSEDQLTFCGACHGDMQARWERTEHARAWAGLQSSDHAEAFCEACHTVNSLGNVVAEPTPGMAAGGHVAYTGQDGRYLDVQCESCHGPGLEHVLDPGVANVPLAPMDVGADLSFGCGECHQGTHHPFVEEWTESPHADLTELAATNVADGCASCHTGEGGLQRLGVRSDYLEKEALESADHYAQITCVVCHDPHGSDNAAQLRRPVTTTDASQHLCAACHDRHARPDTDLPQDYVRTHAPATGLVAANAGWFPPGSGLQPGSVTHPHGQAERLCASCHVVGRTVADPESGETFYGQGHRFIAAPCVDAAGMPTGARGCAYTAAARDFTGCLECHDTEAQVETLIASATGRLLPKVQALAGRLARIDPNGSAPGGAISGNDYAFTPADGAYFTLTVALSGAGVGAPEQVRRSLAAAATHNPALTEALLDAAIEALDAAYPAAAGAPVAPASWWATWTEH